MKVQYIPTGTTLSFEYYHGKIEAYGTVLFTVTRFKGNSHSTGHFQINARDR